jgi:hypothetical protein
LCARRFASFGPARALPLSRLSAFTVSLHVARLRRFTTMLNPRQILAFTPWQHVRFGSKADMCTALAHVRFTPNSDRESGHSLRGSVNRQGRARGDGPATHTALIDASVLGLGRQQTERGCALSRLFH